MEAQHLEMQHLGSLLKSTGFPQTPDTPVYAGSTACVERGNRAMGGRERTMFASTSATR